MKAEVKETIQELQECIEVQKKTYTNLQDEYSNYQVVSNGSLLMYTNNLNYYLLLTTYLVFFNQVYFI